MNILVKSLGVISQDENSFVKFILLTDNVLVFGRCVWHRDLVIALYGKDAHVTVIAAGVLPKDVSKAPLDEAYWGDWKSSGYEVVTPPEYRTTIKSVMISFEEEINALWGK